MFTSCLSVLFISKKGSCNKKMISVRKGEYVVCSFLAAILRPNLYSRTLFPTEPIHHSHFHPVGDLTAPQDLTCSLKNACNLFYKILHRKNTNAIIH